MYKMTDSFLSVIFSQWYKRILFAAMIPMILGLLIFTDKYSTDFEVSNFLGFAIYTYITATLAYILGYDDRIKSLIKSAKEKLEKDGWNTTMLISNDDIEKMGNNENTYIKNVEISVGLALEEYMKKNCIKK